MMLISVQQIKKELGQQQSFQFITAANELDLDENSPYRLGTINITGQITNLGESLLVEGTITALGRYECNRCLEVFERIEKIVFSECFREKGQPLSHGQSERDFLSYDDDMIKIDELIREHLLMNEPMQPLCNENCLGLCPVCGGNRNQKKCNCTLTTVDPRLAVLSQLIQEK